jgi:hypothetical protein
MERIAWAAAAAAAVVPVLVLFLERGLKERSRRECPLQES